MKCIQQIKTSGTGNLDIVVTHVWTWAGSGEVPEGTPCDCGMHERGGSFYVEENKSLKGTSTKGKE